MNNCAMHQNAFAAWEEARGAAANAAVDRRHAVVCPRPRRFGQLSCAAEPFRPLRWHANCQVEPSDSKAGAELLDIFLTKGGGGDQGQVASSPPFFCGSPPTRSANPMVHDARFAENRPGGPFSPGPMPHASSPMSPTRKGYVPTKFALKPAAVRIEGFDCDRRSRSITAVA